jgi:hypothetical protein
VTTAVDPARFEQAPRFADYLQSVVKYADLWNGVYRMAVIQPEVVERIGQVAGVWRMLALAEDWCGDAVSTLPVIARLAEQSGFDLRVLGRDANPDLMDAHLTSGSRSIPVVMVLDAAFHERAWWGPRPAAVQRWMTGEALLIPKEDRNRRKRAWYARDRGRTTVAEVVEAVERAGRRLPRPPL